MCKRSFHARRLKIPGNSRDIMVRRGRTRIPRASNLLRGALCIYVHTYVGACLSSRMTGQRVSRRYPLVRSPLYQFIVDTRSHDLTKIENLNSNFRTIRAPVFFLRIFFPPFFCHKRHFFVYSSITSYRSSRQLINSTCTDVSRKKVISHLY